MNLIEIAPEDRTADLRARLTQSDASVRAIAAHSLGCMGRFVRLWDVAALRYAAGDADPCVRESAVRALGLIARGLVTPTVRGTATRVLRDAIGDCDQRVREVAERALRGL
jgi:HEAT repeat protein